MSEYQIVECLCCGRIWLRGMFDPLCCPDCMAAKEKSSMSGDGEE